MRTVRRSALVPYSAARMFTLVDDVERYPEFLPWCHRAIVHQRDATQVDASLELRRGGFSKTFTTRNTLHAGRSIELALLDGPFRHLHGIWTFDSLGEAGCKVALDLRFEIESRMMDVLLGPLFEEICNSLVDAFTKRAADIYGVPGTTPGD